MIELNQKSSLTYPSNMITTLNGELANVTYGTVAADVCPIFTEKDGEFGIAGGFREENSLSSIIKYHSLFVITAEPPAGGWYINSSPYFSVYQDSNGIAAEAYSKFCEAVKSWKFKAHFKHVEDFLGWTEMLRSVLFEPAGAGFEVAFFSKPMARLGQRLFCLRHEGAFLYNDHPLPWESRYWYFGYKASLPSKLDLFYLDMETRTPGAITLFPPESNPQFVIDTRWQDLCLGILSHANPLLGGISF